MLISKKVEVGGKVLGYNFIFIIDKNYEQLKKRIST